MLETNLSGVMDDELIEQLRKIAETFVGKQVRVTIEEDNGQKKRK